MDDKRKALASLVLLSAMKPRKRKRSRWSEEWLKKRDEFSHMKLLKELKENNQDDFRNYLRMSDEVFQEIHAAVAPFIQKQDTILRKAISSQQRLIATLRFLATGRSLEDLKFSTAISPQALGRIIFETCTAIWHALRDQYMKFPSTENEWLAVAADFEAYWNFPNCGGAIDGKHVRILSPAGSGSYYHNYKGFKSVILMAIVNANYEFMMVDVGRNGRMSDGGVFQTMSFCTKLNRQELNLPSADINKEGLNFVFLGDDAFALHENLLKPFPLRNLTIEKRVFNYRVCRARRVVENAFGILSNRFRIFHATINMIPKKIDAVVLACCILHNVLRQKNKSGYSPTTMIDREDIESRQLIPGSWRNELQQLTPLQANLNNSGQDSGKQNREKYVTYFNTTGAVPWQNDMA